MTFLSRVPAKLLHKYNNKYFYKRLKKKLNISRFTWQKQHISKLFFITLYHDLNLRSTL